MNYAALFSEVTTAVSAPRTAATAAPAVGLSDEQTAALQAPYDKSAMVCAGAGAGKTRLLVERVSALLRAGANPKRVAVVTFTRKAAKEVSTRVLLRVGDKRKLPVCSTVHALALTTLVRRGELFNLATAEQEQSCLDSLSDLLPPEFEDFLDSEILLLLHRTREERAYGSLVGMVAAAYEERLEEAGLDDFTTMLTRGCSAPQDLFDHIIVDETQDLSRLQLEFLQAIGPTAKYWFIGDPDQGIYSFRGAQASMMHLLKEKVDLEFTLPTNYRSARSIVHHANNVISNNTNRFPIVWRTERTDEGSVSVEFHSHGEGELEHARSWLKAGGKGQRCVLARTQALVAPLRADGLLGMTVHESKGLEWPQVMVMGCEGALFPHPLAEREEERRLFYVAMTRAKDDLVLSACESRATTKAPNRKRAPSPFLFETQALQAKT